MWKRTAGAQLTGLVLTGLVLTGLVLTGCGASGEAGAPVPQPGVADAPVGMAVEAQKPDSVVQRSVITTAQMSVRVEAVEANPRTIADLERHSLIVYLGRNRDSHEILKQQSAITPQNRPDRNR